MVNQVFLDTYGAVPLEELIDKIRLFSLGELSQEELDGWSGEKIIMRANIGILEKQAIMFEAVSKVELSDLGAEFNLLELEKYKFFHVLIGTYTNITIPEDKEDALCNFKNYDLIMPLVKPWVLKACEFDYRETCALIDQNFDWHRLKDLMTLMDSFNVDKLEELTARNEEFVRQMQTEEGRAISQQLLDIVAFNDPATAKIVNATKYDTVLKLRDEDGKKSSSEAGKKKEK